MSYTRMCIIQEFHGYRCLCVILADPEEYAQALSRIGKKDPAGHP